jgi:hypothetical protein
MFSDDILTICSLQIASEVKYGSKSKNSESMQKYFHLEQRFFGYYKKSKGTITKRMTIFSSKLVSSLDLKKSAWERKIAPPPIPPHCER